jgi:hypothetical protein
MNQYELNNAQRKYFGLALVERNWERVAINASLTVYYEGDTIVKLLDYRAGYSEYDVDIHTKQRMMLVPKSGKGKEQRLTAVRLLKIKGVGVQFSSSFQGGGIHIYHNKRNLFFIKSYPEEGVIKTYSDIEKWVTSYIDNARSAHFEWLSKELTKKRQNIKCREGDIIAYKIGQEEFGFARILVDVFSRRNKGDNTSEFISWFHPRSLIVAPYAFYADTLQVDSEMIVQLETMPSVCILDLEVYRGEMPIVGYVPLKPSDKLILPVDKSTTLFTMPYTKTDIDAFISNNRRLNG